MPHTFKVTVHENDRARALEILKRVIDAGQEDADNAPEDFEDDDTDDCSETLIEVEDA